MPKLFPTQSFATGLRAAALALALLAGVRAAHGQASTIYALGTFTRDFSYGGQSATKGTQALAPLAASNPDPSNLLLVTRVATGQQLVGLDTRPNTGQLYALGYDNTAGASPNAQLYLMTIVGATVVAQPVGSAITLALGLSNRTDLDGYNLVVGVGFDFDPRADLIRVTGRNGTNYRLSPASGQVVATDNPLAYAATGNAVPPPGPPLIGAVAYTNAAIGPRGTTLYDVDETPNNGVLSIQSQTPASSGTLTTVAGITLTTSGTYGIGSADLDLDIFTDAGSQPARNFAYLLELTDKLSSRPGTANLYNFDLSTGNAVRINNIISGQIPLRFTNIAAAPANPPAVWTGAVSTDWGTANNWNPAGVPGAGTDVFIAGPGPAVLRQSTVSNAQQARTVILSTGAQGTPAVLTTTAAGTLNVAGDFLNTDGSLTGSGTIALTGAASQDISGPALSQFGNLRVGAAGATLSGPATVQGGLTLTGSLAIDGGQPFTLLSNAGGTAYVVNNGGAATGTATVQRYITPTNPGLGYRHYSAPVTNTTVGDLATSSFTPVFNAAYNTNPTPGTTTPFPTVYGYDQTQYENSPATTITLDFDKGFYSPASDGDAWPSGTGFTANLGSSEMVDFVGTLANGAISTPGQGRSAKANAGWQLLGNPYPSSLDWDQVVATGLSNIAPTVYVSKSSGQYTGSYASYVNGQGTNGGTNVIPVAQGFFVRTSAVGATGNLNFMNSQRITTDATAPFQRTAADTRPQLLLELGNGTLASQTDIYFQSGATAGFDNAFDATALPFLSGLTLASETGNDVLAINGQPALSAAVTVPLRVAVATAGTYSLRAADLANLPAGYHAFLRDAVLNTYTDLATSPSVSLNLASGAATGRFAVVFTNVSPLATAPAALASVYPSPASGKATLVLPQALRGNATSTVQLLNALGQAVLTRTVAPGSADAIELPLTGLAAGIYTVRATTVAGQVAKRLVIE